MVYLVIANILCDEYDTIIIGGYSSREKAEQAFIKWFKDLKLNERYLDKENFSFDDGNIKCEIIKIEVQ